MADYIKLYHFSGKFFGLLLNQFVILPGLFGKYRGQGALVLTQKVQVKLQTGPKVIQKIYQKSGRVFIVIHFIKIILEEISSVPGKN